MAPSRGPRPLPRALHATLNTHKGPVNIARYSKGSAKYLLTGGQDRTVRLWNANLGTEIKVFSAHGYEVLSLAVANDNAKFASAGGDRSVFIWDVATATTLRRLSGHLGKVHAVEFNEDASVVASGSYDATVRLWDLRSQSRQPIQVLEEARDTVQSIYVGATIIVTGSVDGYVRTYDIRMGELRHDFIGHPVTCVVPTQDNQTYLVTSLDSHIRLMDMSTGRLLNDFTGHVNGEYRCRGCFGHAEASVACGDEKGMIWAWDLMDAKVLAPDPPPKVHHKVITWTEHHPTDAGEMITASADGTVKVWRDTDEAQLPLYTSADTMPMDTLSTPVRSRTHDTSKPEADLAEWTSRIKALQRQVDADDEAEQRRLEEEIAAARKARLRRSRASESAMNVDSSRITPPDSGPVTSEERMYQSDGSMRLTNAWYNDKRAAHVETPNPQNARMHQPLPSRKSEPMSLAAFIGGRATGPRLNKHAPQQDATDPTQFEQRITVDAPHPVFGRGGVAMPGLTGQRPSAVRAQVASNIDQVPITVRSQSRTPPVAKKHGEKAREHVPASRKTGDEEIRTPKPGDRRQVTVTKWAGNADDTTGSRPPRVREKIIFPHTDGGKEQPVLHQKTGSRERAISTPAGLATSAVHPSSSSSERKIQSIRAVTPNSDWDVPSSSVASSVNERQPYGSSNMPNPTQKHHTAFPLLARPIQPEPRHLPQSVVFPSSVVPSPAFMKQSPAKELTPSISRLHGRGFVQSMVKISSQLENPAIVPSSPTKSRSHRKSSVLERWPPVMETNSAPSPPVSPRVSSVTTAHPSVTNVTRPSSAEPAKKILRMRASLPSISQGLAEDDGADLERHASLLKKMPPDGTPGLGSATTMAIYKPSLSPLPVETEFTNVDELGIRTKPLSMVDAKKAFASAELPSLSGTPLSYPTKNRAKKPRKVRRTQIANQEQEELPSRSAREQGRVAAKTQAMPGFVIAEAKTTEVQALPMSTTIVRHFEPPEPHAMNNGIGSSNVASKLSETAATSTAVSPITASITLPEQSKRTLRVGKALPGLMSLNKGTDPISNASPPKSPPSIFKDSVSITSLHKSPSLVSKPDALVHAAVRHLHPAMTPTVMDVAFPFNQHMESASKNKISELQILSPPVVSVPRTTPPENKAEKRESALGKYSSIVLPALKEEATPAPSPHVTLSRDANPPNSMYSNDNAASSRGSQVPSDITTTRVMHLNYDDAPLPVPDIDRLLQSSTHPELCSPRIQTISIEVLNIIGATATLISHHANIFYDTEILGVVHRFKSEIGNLVSTTLWIWRGKQSRVNDKEERKIQKLARRYGTNVVMINQCSEPPQLVYLLGGQLAIRQGSRSRWASENTMMHLVRQHNGVIYIDELDLSVNNLCSAFSYCISMLNSIYVWYGCGSTEVERQAALRYAQDFTPDGQRPTELSEGESDGDHTFWMMLGGQDYAKADYWKWRKEAITIDPIIWRVQAKADPAVTQLYLLSPRKGFHEGVYIIDCIWEFFVLVGYQARGYRQDIRLALVVALGMSKKLSPNRPFSPTVHVLVLPSQLPLDLRLNFRNLDEEFLNDGDVPDHMNILSAPEASGHLQKLSWDTANLKDERMLPLGIDISHAS
ncbi:hypothetical protein APHAL10511_004838 [Amanita phalloides]|nr:hypothetical protein APHAL10511_004838 [Amanita phalloides]